MASVSSRALRLLPRDLEAIIPALLVPLFFLVVTIGAIQNLADQAVSGLDYKAFQLPVAIMTAVTGMSRANSLVIDISGGYFDRLLMTPINRYALLLGLMVADFTLFMVMAVPVIALGFAIGVGFGATGVLGLLVFVLFGALWGLAYTGFPYAIALRTGNPAAVNSSFLLFFPLLFMAPAFAPLDVFDSWLKWIATVNPVTYIMEGMRGLVMDGYMWPIFEDGQVVGVKNPPALHWAFVSLAGFSIFTLTIASLALRARTRAD